MEGSVCVCVTLTPPHLSSRFCHPWGNTEVGRSCWGQLPLGLSELKLHWGLGTRSIPWKRKAFVPLCSPGTWRTPVVDSPSSNSVKTSICREGSTPSPQTGGRVGKKEKAPSKYKPLPPGHQRPASWRQYWDLTRESTPSSTAQSLTWNQQPSFK